MVRGEEPTVDASGPSRVAAMRLPVLLAVDEDRATLESVEAQLVQSLFA
jgi:hypothetical protein